MKHENDCHCNRNTVLRDLVVIVIIAAAVAVIIAGCTHGPTSQELVFAAKDCDAEQVHTDYGDLTKADVKDLHDECWRPVNERIAEDDARADRAARRAEREQTCMSGLVLYCTRGDCSCASREDIRRVLGGINE